MTERETIGDVFERERQRRGWSAAHLCREAGISPTTYSFIARNLTTDPDTDTVMRLADALELDRGAVLEHLGYPIYQFPPHLQRMINKILTLPPDRQRLVEAYVDMV